MIKVQNLSKSFGSQKILDCLNLEINNGDFLAIIGSSGTGKSVLLKNIIGLIKPDKGEVFIDGENTSKLRGKEQEKVFRLCGYVFQFSALLDSLNVLENVGLPDFESGKSFASTKEKVSKKLKDVGLGDEILTKYPSELSGGMKKRVGLARTLMREPKILIYDEPTTGLDPVSTKVIHELMLKTHKTLKGRITIVISHDLEIFKYCSKVAMLFNGKIEEITEAESIWESKNEKIYKFIRGLDK